MIIFLDKLITSMLFIATLLVGVSSAESIQIQIAAGNNDAEECSSNNLMYLTSSDLELISDPGSSCGGNQEVGMRFQNINIPKGATITNANIVFTVDEKDTGTTNLVFHGQDTDDAPIFSSSSSDISNREKTTAFVSWNNVPAWSTIGAAGPDQTTPDLSPIIQEIVDRQGWLSGNDMVIIVTGSGERTAEAYNGGSSLSPTLNVEWSAIVDNTTPSVPQNLAGNATSDSQIDLTWTVSIDPESGIDHYNIHRDGVNVAQSPTTTYSDTGLTGATAYMYEVSAVNGANLGSIKSNFIFETTLSDAFPPILSNGQPTGSLTPGTTSTTLSLITDEAAMCKYSTTPGTAYSVMANNFSSTGGMFHSTTVTGLTDGNTFNYYIKCQDQVGNVNTIDFLITFSVASPSLGIVGLWPLNSDTLDYSGNGLDMINHGADCSAFVSGKFGTACDFNRANKEYLEVDQAIVAGVPFTVCLWFNTDNIAKEVNLFTISDKSSSNNYHRLLLKSNGNIVKIQSTGGSGTSKTAVTSISWTANTWHSACGVFAANNDRRVYLDGSGKGTNSASVTPSGLDRTSIGRVGDSTPSGYMSGLIDQVTFWNRTLSDEEIEAFSKESLDSTVPSSPQNLIAIGISENEANLSWNQSIDPESGIDHYNIYRDGVNIAQSPTTTYSDTGLIGATKYTYEVSAVNGVNLESIKSISTSATTFADIVPPNVISAVASGTNTTKVIVEFSEPVEAISATNVSNYNVNNSITVTGASLSSDQRTVTLTTSLLTGITIYTLTISNIEDLSGNVMPLTSIKYILTIKVAFIGDLDVNNNAQAVLQLIKDEGVDFVMHQGDLGYGIETDPQSAIDWDNQVSSILGPDFPYFATIGNHDLKQWSVYQQKLQERLNKTNATCTGDLGVKSSCRFKGLFFILSGAGTMGSGHDTYIRDELLLDNSIWSICSWHKNQNEMQVGFKLDEVGWGPYEECRKGGAIIATAHEHSYERTKTLVSTEFQTVDPAWTDPNNLTVKLNSTFVVVSGIAGRSIRNQDRCLPTTYPYGCNNEWAKIYTSDQGAQFGALFIDFHVDGDLNKARGYFKNINKEIIDTFEILSGINPDTSAPTTPANLQGNATSDSQIDLTWTASIDPESGIDHYNIYRDGVNIAQSPTTTYSDTGLTSATTYTYEVSAVNGAGLESVRSNSVNVTTITVTVNQLPFVVASFTRPYIVYLGGNVTDDGLPNGTLITTWSKVSGPGTVIFENPNAISTNATFFIEGNYTLRLTADDGSNQSSDDIVVKIINPLMCMN